MAEHGAAAAPTQQQAPLPTSGHIDDLKEELIDVNKNQLALAPMECLPDEMLEEIFSIAILDTKTLLTVVPAVCRRWRAVYGQTRNVHLDFDFVPARAPLRLHAGDAIGARMLGEVVKRMAHVVGLKMFGWHPLEDASVVALAEHCPHLTHVNFSFCQRLTDASVVALAEHCPHMTHVDFGFCNRLRDASVVALAEHCPQLTYVDFTALLFRGGMILTDASVVALAGHCPYLTRVEMIVCAQLTKASADALAQTCPHLQLSNGGTITFNPTFGGLQALSRAAAALV